MAISWTSPTHKISNHFTVKDACLLPSWGVMHHPSLIEEANILAMAASMEKVRAIVGKPINVHCWIRPTLANCPGPHYMGNYNLAAGSTAPHSAHILGNAVDWDCGDDCDSTRAFLLPHIEALGLRMENRPGSTWIHLDCVPVPPGGHRFFLP